MATRFYQYIFPDADGADRPPPANDERTLGKRLHCSLCCVSSICCAILVVVILLVFFGPGGIHQQELEEQREEAAQSGADGEFDPYHMDMEYESPCPPGDTDCPIDDPFLKISTKSFAETFGAIREPQLVRVAVQC